MKNFKILRQPRNAAKVDLRVSPKSISEFKTRIIGTKFYLTPFWFYEKS